MVVEWDHRAVGAYVDHVLVVPVPQSCTVSASPQREVADRLARSRRQITNAVIPSQNCAGVQALAVLIDQIYTRRPVLQAVGKAHHNAGRGTRSFPLPPHQLIARLDHAPVQASGIVKRELIPLETAV